jgi:type I restriction enzyme M protein
MLDSVTKKRIDDLRNILVGKIPSPQSQVEQITTGLIYKFMFDMDEEAVEMGGVPSFFIGDYEKYSWKHLFDPKLGGADKVNLYSEAIEAMYTNPTAPALFREIFKNSFLPFKDPSTLNMFLKEINEFHYSHSEKLGDAFEYLLSFMGSQGDAGQFRTPRHIIDFIVEIVNPQKNETILDPACGTAGFLISSYKHILSQNTDKKVGDKLSATERKEVGDNLVGYDISPDMTRISLVNMYLHQFASPQIHEYDTLSSEDRWNEYYDVILANPPFFSPTGGIQPHSRFGVQSTRAEVLFVDYIMEHLKPTGRAGIVVPEGIIFQTGTAYKTLRKKLVEDCLVGVISLPAGVFQPYSGVKTSILILDKALNQKSDSIFFAKVENDGFSLGAQRTKIQNNDIPHFTKQIQSFFEGEENSLLFATKHQIQAKDFKLSQGEYEVSEELNTDFDIVELGDVLVGKPIYGSGAKKSEFDGEVRYLRITDITDDGRLKVHDPVSPNVIEPEYFLNLDDFLIARSGSVGRSYLHKQTTIPCQFAGYLIKFPLDKTKVNPNYLSYITKSEQFSDWISRKKKDGTISNINAKEYSQFRFPLPPIEVQQQIVDELEGYQKIIDGCRQVVENYKPTIDIDPSWEMVELKNLYEANLDSKRVPITKGDRKAGEIPYYGASGIVDYVDGYLFDEDLLLISEDGANLKDRNYPIAFSISGKTWVNNHAHVVRFNDRISQKYVEFYFNQISLEPYLTGSAQPKLNQATLNSIKVPVPSKEDMERIVDRIEEEKGVIEGNSKLMGNLTQKIQDRISKVWGD